MRIGDAAKAAFDAGDSWDEIAVAVVRQLLVETGDDPDEGDDPAGIPADFAAWAEARAALLRAVAVPLSLPAEVVASAREFVRLSDRCLGLEGGEE